MNSTLRSVDLPETATTEAAAILSSVPGIVTAIRDEHHRIVRCNPAYSEIVGVSGDDLVGLRLTDLRPGAAADERTRLLEQVRTSDIAQDFLQFWNGRAWLCRIIPLDRESFGIRGTLTVVMQAPIGTKLADARSILVLDTADFGELSVLTRAEKRTIYDLAMGRSNNEIAERQNRSVRTIECHVRAIHEKLKTSSRSAIIREASERGIQLFDEDKWETMAGMKANQKRAQPFRTAPLPKHKNGISPNDSSQSGNGTIEPKG